MYLYKQIDVRLTQNKTELLRRPSKIFNTLKSLFSGEMTPTQQKQADVMLSVIQRLNVAMRRSGFSNLVSIDVNNELVYDSSEQADTELEQTNATLVEGFENGSFKSLDSMQITVDGEDEHLTYLISVSVMRKPKHQDTPVNIMMYGFIREFGRQTGETEDAFSVRVKSLIAQHWGTAEQRQKELDALESVFEQQVTRLSEQINEQFPAGIDVSDTEKRLREHVFSSRHRCHQDRYDYAFGYLPIFYLNTHSAYSHEGDDVIIDNQTNDWERTQDAGGAYGAGAGSDSWADKMEVGDAGGDAGASCGGGGCGGGCGGA